jgi:ABC-2 type transport system permease protein
MTRASRSSVVAVWWAILRSIATRVRLAGLGLLGLAAIVLGLSVRLANPTDRSGAAWSLVDSYGLSLLIPVVALVFATAALGDAAEDGTLVYLWLRPLPRWKLAVSAFAASVTAVLPIAVAPLVAGAAITGGGAQLVGAAAAGGTLATVAYSAVFCGLGLRVRRALAWGLAYLLIWEQAVARVSHGAARVSLFVSTRSLAAHLAQRPPPRNAVEWTTGLIFPLVVAAVALALTTRSLDRGELT